MTTEQFNEKQKNVIDSDLIKELKIELSKLCKTYGKSFKMSIPPQINDTDMLICEIIERFEKLTN